ncbi:MAG: glycosyltransferase family 2 protein [Candidatus Zixiibacteriota bacterium]
MSAPAVSIIIVTHNSAASLGATLDSLSNGCGGHSYECIVVDNGSDDGTISLLESKSEVHLLPLQCNTGFASASNRGAGKATGEFLLFLNPDVVLDSGSVGSLIEGMRIRPSVGLVAPRLRNSDGSFQPSCRRFPTPFNILFSRGSFLGKHLSQIAYTLPDFADANEVPAVAGASMLIKRSTFQEIGGFDERFFLYMEDTDLCLRLYQRGLKSWYFPAAGAVHGWGRGSSSGRLFRLWHHHLSTWKYFLKHLPNGFTLFLLPFLLIANFAVSVVALPFRSRA